MRHSVTATMLFKKVSSCTSHMKRHSCSPCENPNTENTVIPGMYNWQERVEGEIKIKTERHIFGKAGRKVKRLSTILIGSLIIFFYRHSPLLIGFDCPSQSWDAIWLSWSLQVQEPSYVQEDKVAVFPWQHDGEC